MEIIHNIMLIRKLCKLIIIQFNRGSLIKTPFYFYINTPKKKKKIITTQNEQIFVIKKAFLSYFFSLRMNFKNKNILYI